MKRARSSTTARLPGWKRTAIAGRRPTPTCAGSDRTPSDSTLQIEDITEQVAALALQGPTSGKLLKSVAEADIENLKYFRKTSGKIGGVAGRHFAHRLHRRSGLRNLDSVAGCGEGVGRADGRRAQLRHSSHRHAGAGCGAHRGGTDPGRRGLHQQQEGADCLAEVQSCRSWLGQAGPLRQGQLHRPRGAAGGKAKRAEAARWWDLEIDWNDVEALFEHMGLAPQTPATASRVHVPVYRGREQVGKATSTTWSPLLKQLIALASVESQHAQPGTKLQIEMTVEAVRHKVRRDGAAAALLQSSAQDPNPGVNRSRQKRVPKKKTRRCGGARGQLVRRVIRGRR